MTATRKKVLITGGPVPAPLDRNKLVISNRVRGVWAQLFATHLAKQGHEVILLLPDTLGLSESVARFRLTERFMLPGYVPLRVVYHEGFWDYFDKCRELAPWADAAVMAGAVVNWIPQHPFEGKMPTKGFQPGDVRQIPFVLAPRVIDEMKALNPKLTLIGCKMTVDATEEDMIEAAYGTLLGAKCNVVVANDMGHGLKRKLLVYPDRSVHEYDNDFTRLFEDLEAVVNDEHYSTVWTERSQSEWSNPYCPEPIFDRIVSKYRHRFVHRQAGVDRVFGSVYVPNKITGLMSVGFVSPREKGSMFSSKHGTVIRKLDSRVIHVEGPSKATLNAPLLVRVAMKYPHATAVLHLHEQTPGAPTVPYAPPGTVRDNEREIPAPVFNIEGHGFIACLNWDHEIWDHLFTNRRT